MFSPWAAVALASLTSVATAQNVLSLSPSAQAPSGASQIISPSFAGLGIEASNLYSFTGGTSENTMSTNLLNNLANYTGAPPHLRIGGNTQDYMIYDSSMDDYQVKTNPNPVGQGAFATDLMIIGPRFFEVLNRFPKNTPITLGLNLAYIQSDYIARITAMATEAVQALTNLNLVGFEIGNEPDLYLQNGFRTGAWSGQIYTQQWLDRASAIWEQVLSPNGLRSNFFEPGTTASTIGTSFEIGQLAGDDITIDANGSSSTYVSTWNQHDYYYYIGVSTSTITLSSFMTWSTTNNQFAAWTTQIGQAFTSGYPYALREMGVVGPIGLNGITDVFGAALWHLNFFLYAATLNMSSVQMHMTDNSNASAWQPIPYYGNQPHIRPNYYGFAAFTQAIGASCQATVATNAIGTVPAGYDGRLTSYSVYQDNTLDSIVVINGMMANVSESNKNSITIDLTLPTQFAGQTLYLAYLTADGADAMSGTTFNGISYETSGDGTPTLTDSSSHTASIGGDGSVSVALRDSQAVVARIGTKVGDTTVNASACAALAAATPDAKTGSASSNPSTTSSASGSTSSTNAASSMTGSSPSASATSGVVGLSKMLLGTIFTALVSGIALLLV